MNAPIGRDPKDRKKMAINEQNGKPAITHYKVLRRFQEYTYIECQLETGRTHQIRVHMSSIGHPCLVMKYIASVNLLIIYVVRHFTPWLSALYILPPENIWRLQHLFRIILIIYFAFWNNRAFDSIYYIEYFIMNC